MKLLDELERLEREATPRPWEAIKSPRINGWHRIQGPEALVTGETQKGFREPCAGQDHQLIAKTRNALPALLRVARAANEIKNSFQMRKLPECEHWGYTGDGNDAFKRMYASLAELESQE